MKRLPPGAVPSTTGSWGTMNVFCHILNVPTKVKSFYAKILLLSAVKEASV